MFRSATFKLTMWYLALVMLISVVFSAALYGVATGELSRGLHRETQRIDTQFPVIQNDPQLAPSPNSDFHYGAHRILIKLIGFNVIVFIGAGFASYWLARRTLEPIEAAHEQQKRFTADVSHELRTPLTALRMETEVALLNEPGSAKELRQTLTSNLEEVSKIEILINNLLRLSRLETGELQQAFVNCDSAIIGRQAIEQVRMIAEQHTIAIKTELVPASVLGDQNSLQQLVVILLDNAIKYSPAHATVTIRNQKVKDRVRISITDQGVGIEPTALEHLFERFYRADSSRTKNDTAGFGLGLSIAKMIADVHSGNITISSQPGKGTTVIIDLPAAQTITQATQR